MKKRTFTQVLSCVLVAFMIIGVFPVFGASEELKGTTKDGFEYVIEDGEVTITHYASDNPIVNIPSTIEGYPVTAIGYGAFRNVISDPKNITEVTIPDTVKIIKSSAFAGCAIESITIPESVASIEPNAFNFCQLLEEITLPKGLQTISSSTFLGSKFAGKKDNWKDGALYLGSVLLDVEESVEGDFVVKKGTTVIANEAFYECTLLKNVTIPEGVITIGGWAFYNCTALESVTIPNTVRNIGSYAFYWCTSLKGQIVIPKGVTAINESTFFNCQCIESVIIPDTVKYIGRFAFEYAPNAEFTIPESVERIEYEAVKCSAPYNNTDNWQDGVLYLGSCLIESNKDICGDYIVKDGTTLIAEHAFLFCRDLESITIPEGVKYIGIGAFDYCSSLKTIVIPKSMIYIDYGAFNWRAINDAYFGGTQAQWEILTAEFTEDLSGVNVHFAEEQPSQSESNPATADELEYLIGDANSDGNINVKDATQVQKFVASLVILNDIQYLAADANEDGVVNIKDATAIQKFIAGILDNSTIGNDKK